MQERQAKAVACPVFPMSVHRITWRVRRLLSSVWIQARRVSSVIKIWAALAKSTGASALIICNRRRPSLSVTGKSFKPVSCPLPHVLPLDYGARNGKWEGGSLKRFQGKINPQVGTKQVEGKREKEYLSSTYHVLSYSHDSLLEKLGFRRGEARTCPGPQVSKWYNPRRENMGNTMSLRVNGFRWNLWLPILLGFTFPILKKRTTFQGGCGNHVR